MPQFPHRDLCPGVSQAKMERNVPSLHSHGCDLPGDMPTPLPFLPPPRLPPLATSPMRRHLTVTNLSWGKAGTAPMAQ